MKMIFKGAVRDEFIDEQPLSSGGAIADQRHQVAVVHSANNIDLRLELAVALPAVGFKAFHRYFLPVGQHALVHVPEAPLPQQILLGEPARRRRQIFVREAALAEP